MISTILDPIMYLIMKISIRISLGFGEGDLLHNNNDCPNGEVGLCPKLLKNICAIGWVAVDEGLQVWSHAKCKCHVEGLESINHG